MKLGRPSPALVISIVALVAACAGTAVAATVITTKQIKNGTIQNIDIKDTTIQSKKLSKGIQTVLNRKAPAAPAPPPPKIAYEHVRKSGPENQPANQLVRVTSMTVPPGAYVATANTIMTAFTGKTDPLEALLGTNASQGGVCVLDAAGVTATSLQNIVINDRQAPATLGMQLTRTLGAASDVVLKCTANIAWRASESSIIATKVDAIDLKEEK